MIPFSIEEMIKALEAIGYTVKYEEELVDESRFNNYKREKLFNVYQPYYKGEKVAGWAGHGTKRLEYCFNQELQKRLLALFV